MMSCNSMLMRSNEDFCVLLLLLLLCDDDDERVCV